MSVHFWSDGQGRQLVQRECNSIFDAAQKKKQLLYTFTQLLFVYPDAWALTWKLGASYSTPAAWRWQLVSRLRRRQRLKQSVLPSWPFRSAIAGVIITGDSEYISCTITCLSLAGCLLVPGVLGNRAISEDCHTSRRCSKVNLRPNTDLHQTKRVHVVILSTALGTSGSCAPCRQQPSHTRKSRPQWLGTR
jgi:hypothetical protein